MRKITVALALVLVVALAAPAVQGETFPDVDEDHWAYEAVEALVAAGVVEGYPDGEYKGDETMTRYEMAMIIQRALDNINEEFERVDQDIMYLEDDISELEDGLTAAQAEDVVAIVERMIEEEMPEMPDELTEQQAEEVTEIVEAMIAEFEGELDELEAELGALRYVIETQTDALWAETDDIQDTIDALDARVEDLEEEEDPVTFRGEYSADFTHEEVVEGAFPVFGEWQVTDYPDSEDPIEGFSYGGVDLSDHATETEAGNYYFTSLSDYRDFLAEAITSEASDQLADDTDRQDWIDDDDVENVADLIDDVIVPELNEEIEINAGGSDAYVLGQPRTAQWAYVEGPRFPDDLETFWAFDSSEFTQELDLGLDVNYEGYEATFDVTVYDEDELVFDDAEFTLSTDNLDAAYKDANEVTLTDSTVHETDIEGFTIDYAPLWDKSFFFGEATVDAGEDGVVDWSYFPPVYGEETVADVSDEETDYYLSGVSMSRDVMGLTFEPSLGFVVDSGLEAERSMAGLDIDGELADVEFGGELAYDVDNEDIYFTADSGIELEGLAEISGDIRWSGEDFAPFADFQNDAIFDSTDAGYDQFEDGLADRDELAFNLRVDQDLIDLFEEGYVDYSHYADDYRVQVGGEMDLLITGLTGSAEFERTHSEADAWEPVDDYDDDLVTLGLDYTTVDEEEDEEFGAFDFEGGVDVELSMLDEDRFLFNEYSRNYHEDVLDEDIHVGPQEETETTIAVDGEFGVMEDIVLTGNYELISNLNNVDFDDIDNEQQTIGFGLDVEDYELFDVTFNAGVSYEMISGEDVDTDHDGDELDDDFPADLDVGAEDLEENTLELTLGAEYVYNAVTFSNDFTYVNKDGEAVFDGNRFTNELGVSYEVSDDASLDLSWTEDWFDQDATDDVDFRSREASIGGSLSF